MRKFSRNVTSRDEKTRACNCSTGTRIAQNCQTCIFGLRCQEKCVVYRASCMCCDKFYLGRTSQFLKQRFQTHFNFARLQANLTPQEQAGLPPSSTFTRHLVHHLHTVHDPDETVTLPQVRRLVRVNVLWKGNPVGCSKTFGTVHCRLCMKERIFLLKNQSKLPTLLLNSNIGIHRDCNCVQKMRFHHLERKST